MIGFISMVHFTSGLQQHPDILQSVFLSVHDCRLHAQFHNYIFPSRDKDGGYASRSAIVKNPMLHANFTALSSIHGTDVIVD